MARTAELEQLKQACRAMDQEAADLSKRYAAHRREMDAKVRDKIAVTCAGIIQVGGESELSPPPPLPSPTGGLKLFP